MSSVDRPEEEGAEVGGWGGEEKNYYDGGEY